MVVTPGVGGCAGTIGIEGNAKFRWCFAAGGLASAVGTACTLGFVLGSGKMYFSVAGIGPSIGFGRVDDADRGTSTRISGSTGAASVPFGLTLFPASPGRKLKSGAAGGMGLSASADFNDGAGGAIGAAGFGFGASGGDAGSGFTIG
jgi:hypothetical protein